MVDEEFEIEVYNAGRGFADAQAWLIGQGLNIGDTYPDVECGWYDTRTDPHKGSFALVNPTGRLADFVGDRMRLFTDEDRSVLVYVYASADLATELAIAYRPWVELTFAAEQRLSVRLEVLNG